jgi:hypothetical protein
MRYPPCVHAMCTLCACAMRPVFVMPPAFMLCSPCMHAMFTLCTLFLCVDATDQDLTALWKKIVTEQARARPPLTIVKYTVTYGHARFANAHLAPQTRFSLKKTCQQGDSVCPAHVESHTRSMLRNVVCDVRRST